MSADSNTKRRFGRSIVPFLFLFVPLSGLVACGGGANSVAKSTEVTDATDDGGATGGGLTQGSLVQEAPISDTAATIALESVVISTNYGDIELSLDRDSAPNTVANFLEYVDAGHYDQTIFHRVIPGFMIQGGGFSVDYQRNQTEPPILNEANNGLSNDRYTIAMARTPLAHSATDQFFINVVDNLFLNYSGPTDRAWGYAVFGRVTRGFDVVDDIAAVTTGAAGPFATDAPVELVMINSIVKK